MSLIVGVYVPTGIALSGDSRMTGTINRLVPQSPPAGVGPGAPLVVSPPSPTPGSPGGPAGPAPTTTAAPAPATAVQTNVVLSDAAEKIFVVRQRFGIGTFGDAVVNNMPIAHYVEDFQATKAAQSAATTNALALALLAYFRALSPVPSAGFIVVGYDGTEPWVIGVDVKNGQTNRVNAHPKTGGIDYGIVRGGDPDVVNRLLSHPQFNPPFNLMNLQDAVDFSRHLIRSTIDQMRFEPRFATVGGPVDTLVVSPAGARFLKRKELCCG